jgi:mRNA interferase RelE/StbE
MSYQVVYTKTSIKDIRKLDNVARRRIKKKIESYSENPVSYAKKLIKSMIGSYRWRVGNYRIVFDLDGKDIVILRIGHRREIYK